MWKKHDNKPRGRMRRILRVALSVTTIAGLIGWWFVLRIVEHDSWPIPADAVTPDQAQAATEQFAARESPRRDDVAIPFAPSTASDVELYIEGDQFFPAIIADLESAESSIHIMMFGYSPGEWGMRITDVLIAKQQAGIEVRLSVDKYGSKVIGKNAHLFQTLSNAGVEVVVNDIFPLQAKGILPDRDRSLSQDEIGQTDHRKMIIVDGESAWIGGAGFEDHFATGKYHDVFINVHGDIVRQMQAVFLMSFRAYGGDVASAPGSLASYFPVPSDPGEIKVTLLQNIPGGFRQGTQASRELLEQSSGTLDIMNPYLTDPGIIDRIVDAAHRGVDVRLLISEESNNPPADLALRNEYQRLLNAGVQIFEYPAVMHAKVTVADDTAIIGTINYDAWSLYRNLEIALMIEDAAIADQVRTAWIEPDIANSQSGEPLDGTIDKVQTWICRRLVYFL